MEINKKHLNRFKHRLDWERPFFLQSLEFYVFIWEHIHKFVIKNRKLNSKTSNVTWNKQHKTQSTRLRSKRKCRTESVWKGSYLLPWLSSATQIFPFYWDEIPSSFSNRRRRKKKRREKKVSWISNALAACSESSQMKERNKWVGGREQTLRVDGVKVPEAAPSADLQLHVWGIFCGHKASNSQVSPHQLGVSQRQEVVSDKCTGSSEEEEECEEERATWREKDVERRAPAEFQRQGCTVTVRTGSSTDNSSSFIHKCHFAEMH